MLHPLEYGFRRTVNYGTFFRSIIRKRSLTGLVTAFGNATQVTDVNCNHYCPIAPVDELVTNSRGFSHAEKESKRDRLTDYNYLSCHETDGESDTVDGAPSPTLDIIFYYPAIYPSLLKAFMGYCCQSRRWSHKQWLQSLKLHHFRDKRGRSWEKRGSHAYGWHFLSLSGRQLSNQWVWGQSAAEADRGFLFFKETSNWDISLCFFFGLRIKKQRFRAYHNIILL